MCLANKREMQNFWQTRRFARPFHSYRRRWGTAVSDGRCSFACKLPVEFLGHHIADNIDRIILHLPLWHSLDFGDSYTSKTEESVWTPLAFGNLDTVRSAACHPSTIFDGMIYGEFRWAATGGFSNGAGHCSLAAVEAWNTGQAHPRVEGISYAG